MAEKKPNAERTFTADLELLERMFAEGFPWDKWYESPASDTPEDVFARVYKWHDYRTGNRPRGTVNCGGHEFRDTARTLYRTLYLLRPTEVDFSDMYKTGGLVDFCSPDFEFSCSFQLHKYEACVRFYCALQHAAGEPSVVRGGWASCDNGVYCKSELGKKWFAVAVQAMEREWGVYPGNNFCV
ncbi:hypothetical protein LCGC14_2721630 [marine sediment metagenome]|uniref:Uncharacterized protein n=1 Tax=marine sediment metagenome TaxID=412755 RepID=A0A0F8ZXL0_9ZZZZ